MDILDKRVVHSVDGITEKYYTSNREHCIPSVKVNLPEKTIYCLSSQIGCNGRCIMCKIGNDSLSAINITVDEYYQQINTMEGDESDNTKKKLISFMGQGEPLENIDNILSFYGRYISSHPMSNFAMSTIANELDNLLLVFKYTNMKVTISLHAATDTTRRKIIPTAKTKIKDIVEVTSGHNVEYNYVLLEGINDSREELDKLVTVLPRNTVLKLNKFNYWNGCCIKSVSDDRRLEIQEMMIRKGIPTEIYNTDGTDIRAACGQM